VLRAHEWNALARGAAPRPRRGAHPPSTSPDKPHRETDAEGWLERFKRR
jgi:hypothetical protein